MPRKYRNYSNFTKQYYSFSLLCFVVYRLSFQNEIVGDHKKAKAFWNYVFENLDPFCDAPLLMLVPTIRTDYDGEEWREEVFEYPVDYAHGTTGFHYKFSYKQKNYFKWSIDNLELFPAVDRHCYPAGSVFSNSIPNVDRLVGDYLPVIDSDVILSPDWVKMLGFKHFLDLDDYLYVLEQIWKDDYSSVSAVSERRSMVSMLYYKIAEMLDRLHKEERVKLESWGQNNKLLAVDGSFYPPRDLYFTDVPGLSLDNMLCFSDVPDCFILDLFRLWDVQLVFKDELKIDFVGIKMADESFKKQLKLLLPFFTLIYMQDSMNVEAVWEDVYQNIFDRIEQLTFFEVDRISISYGDGFKTWSRRVWVDDNKFYYVGCWSQVSVLDALVDSLSKFLGLSSCGRILLVLLCSVNELDRVEYLSEMGYDVSLIP